VSVCALERRCCGAMDIGLAYLIVDMLVDIDLVYGSFIYQNGTLVLKME
jgi:hypothetical protein